MKVLDYLLADVLVLGGGVAGCRAAIEAAEHAASVMVVDQGAFGAPRQAAPSESVYAVAQPTRFPGDCWQAHAQDSLRAGAGLGDVALVELLAREALRGAWELDRYGFRWQRSTSGGLDARELPGHRFPRGLSSAADCELSVNQALASHMRSHVGVQILENVFISTLMQHQGRVVGAIGIDRQSGDLLVLVAGSTVLACGGMEDLFNFAAGRGSGVAMAYRLGAEIISPELHIPGDVVGCAVPTPYSLGGLRIDAAGQTSLPALYAAGEAAGGVHGADLLTGNALTHAVVFGAAAGRSAALACRAIPRIKEESVKAEKLRQVNFVKRSLAAKQDALPIQEFAAQLNNHLQEALGPTCSGASIATVQALIDEYSPNWYQQVKFSRTRGPMEDLSPEARIDLIRMDYLLDLARITLKAATMRTESRGVFRRSDFPQASPEWNCRIQVKRARSQDILTTVPAQQEQATAA